MKLDGRTAIVTGGSLGLGATIARRFVEEGASVLVCARGEDHLAAIRHELEPLLRPSQRFVAEIADVSKAPDCDRIVASALSSFGKIDALVNNAGIYGPKGALQKNDWDEWVRTIEINLFGAAYLCRAVLPHFKERRYGKIVNISGGGATSPLPGLSAYAASKAALVRLTETLAQEVQPINISVNAIAPGVLATRMLDEVIAAGPEGTGERFHARMLETRRQGGAPLTAGADLAVFLASAASDGLTGRLISAIWDSWQSMPSHLEELTGSDIYTLRRIEPRDRGKSW